MDVEKKRIDINKVYIFFWVVCSIFLIIGFFLIQTEDKEYSTDEYWVAQNYHHVYERSSGEIVNYIEDDETCEIKGDTIIVRKKGKDYALGMVFVVLFGIANLGFIWIEIQKSKWWNRLTQKIKDITETSK